MLPGLSITHATEDDIEAGEVDGLHDPAIKSVVNVGLLVPLEQ